MKRTIFANINILMTTYFSQGSAATDLRRGDSLLINSNFLHRSLMNLTVKNNENLPTFVEVIARQIWPGTFDTRCTIIGTAVRALAEPCTSCSLQELMLYE